MPEQTLDFLLRKYLKHSHSWGDISGSLALQPDLQVALDGKQPLDIDLTAIAALTSAANKLPYATGVGTWALTDLSPFARTILDDTDGAAARATLGLGTAALVASGVFDLAGAAAAAQAASQPLDSELTALAGLVSASDKLPYFTGSGTASLTSFSAFARTILDDADAATVRSTIGAGTSDFDGAYSSLTGTPSSFSPVAHATSHKSGGSDSIKLDELAAPTDVTTLDSSVAAHGLLPKLSGWGTDALNGDGTWGSGGFPEALGYIGY